MQAQAYENRSGRMAKGIAVMLVLAVLIAAAFVVSMNAGVIRLSPPDVFRTLFGGGTQQEHLILFEFRLPRIVIALLVGAGLAVSGCILQGVSRNALADPSILGINAGAGLMVILFVSFYKSSALVPVFALPALALFGAGAAAACIYLIANKRHEGLSPTRLLLTGIGIAYGVNAVTILLTLRLNPDKYQFVATWMAGSIWGSNWKFVLALLPWVVVLLPFVFFKSKALDILGLGDATATGLGAPVNKERVLLIGCAVALSGACIAVSGGIAFVGLVGPHLARRLVGPRHSLLLPASALCGSLLLIVADTVGRTILQPSEVPTGIVVAVIGAPYFLYLLARLRN